MAMGIAALEQQHAPAFVDEPRGRHGSRGAAADDDVVKTLFHSGTLLQCGRRMFDASCPDLFETLPIERNAVTGTVRRQREAVLDREWLGNVALETEAVGFEIGAVWAGGEKMHGDVVGAMAGDRKIERLRQMGDLHEGGDAAAIG